MSCVFPLAPADCHGLKVGYFYLPAFLLFVLGRQLVFVDS